MTRLRYALPAAALLLLASKGSAQPSAENGFRGQGAANCVAAGELLGARPGADAAIRETVLAWRQVLHVMDGTEDVRRAALDSARASFARMGEAGTGNIAADALWRTTCTSRDLQVRYITVHASAERAQLHLAEEPGTELAPDVVRRLNSSVTCLVVADLFASPPRRLRTALGAASPAAPDAAALRDIQARARRAIDASAGSAAGKALVVDYVRSLFSAADSRPDLPDFVNRSTQHLQGCQSGLPAS